VVREVCLVEHSCQERFRVAKTYGFQDIDAAVSDPGFEYPIFLRYDAGHDSLGQNYQGPFFSADELKKSGLNEGAWEKTEHLDGVIAVQWIDTRDADGLYRKYRAFVFGGHVLKGPLLVSNDWFVHRNNQIENDSTDKENRIFMQSDVTEKEKLTFRRINEALQLDFSAIDYSFDQKGDLIIWEANPHPSLGDWAEEISFKRKFTDVLSAFYESSLV